MMKALKVPSYVALVCRLLVSAIQLPKIPQNDFIAVIAESNTKAILVFSLVSMIVLLVSVLIPCFKMTIKFINWSRTTRGCL